MSSIATVPSYDNNYNNFANMSSRQSGSYNWPQSVTPTTDSHHIMSTPHHMSQSHNNSSQQSQAPTPTTAHHPDPSNITPPPTAASRSGTSSPPRNPGMTPDARDIRRQHSQMRRDSKTTARIKRANSNPYGTEIPSGPPSAGLNSVYGSPQGPPTGGLPILGESSGAPLQSPSYIQPYSPSIPEASSHYAYQSSHMPSYGMPMGYDFHNQQSSPYARSRHPPPNLPMDPNGMMYGTVPSMMSPGMPQTPHSHSHPHVPSHQQHPHAHPHSVPPPPPPHMGGADGNVRVVQTRPKPQCWEHGCNGRQFSTFSNLLRHQREKSGQAAKATCPNCGAEFTRTTARNGHLLHDKCKKRNPNPPAGQNNGQTQNPTSTMAVPPPPMSQQPPTA